MTFATGKLPRSKRIDLLTIPLDRIRVVHYSCALWEKYPTGTPPVGAIALYQPCDGPRKLWATYLEAELLRTPPKHIPVNSKLERKVLEQFFAEVEEYPSVIWVHWQMKLPSFSFAALSQRLRVLGGKPGTIPAERQVNLAVCFNHHYGPDFAPDPQMVNLARRNGLSMMDWLDPAATAEAFKRGDHAAVTRSLARKTEWICRMLELHRACQLQTGPLQPCNSLSNLSPKPDTNVASVEPESREREDEILRALLLLKADGNHRRVSRLQAARKADPECKPSSYNKAIASLAQKGFIKSRVGPRGGIWLTPEGVSRAKGMTNPRG